MRRAEDHVKNGIALYCSYFYIFHCGRRRPEPAHKM